jgi:hypothetical protein
VRRSSRVKDKVRATSARFVLLLSAPNNSIRQPRTRGVSQRTWPRSVLRIVAASDGRATKERANAIEDVFRTRPR